MLPKSRVLIVGGGGIGTIAALNLEIGGLASVTLVLRSNYEVVKNHGFTVQSIDHGDATGWRPSGGVMPRVPNVLAHSLEPFDFIFCCTKNIPEIPPTLAEIVRPAVTPGHSAIVLVQNGLNIEKAIFQAFPENVCLSGVSFCGAEETKPGYVVHNDTDRLDIGAFPGQQKESKAIEAAQQLVQMYAASGHVETNYNQDVKCLRWRKLLINAVYNPISALANPDTSRIRLSSLIDKDGRDIIDGLLKPAMKEVIVAARAVDNVELEEDLINTTVESDPIEAFIAPSMLQDVRKGRFIECQNILGEVIRAAEDVGVEMPIVRTLYHLCNAVQFRTREAYGMVDSQILLKRYRRERL
ncbi:2-dehydropantoate 2-reductase [Cadophora sp. DSE1049]|nr:2-dehydropantoate 2-reductase [Cadophora sp. DSE1049]